MQFNRNISVLLNKTKCVFTESLRTHFKFSVTQTKQQTNLLTKFLNKNQNVLNKLMENKSKIISKGSPNRKEIDSEGVDKRLITRRMTVLNKQLMHCISDVLSTESIGIKIQELEVRITQVKVNNRCDSANIYWVSKHKETEKVAEELDQLKGRLHQNLMDRNFMHSVPWIQFVLDINENHCEEVERILKSCDFGPDFEPSDTTLFETPYEMMSRSVDKPKNKTNDKFKCDENVYQFLKIQKPNDMQMNCLGLDYESIINSVLINLNKSRAQHRSFNAVADPLPPPDWTSKSEGVEPSEQKFESIYNTDQRIKAMKNFLVENRKKREKLSREKKRRIILQDLQISSHLNEAYDTYQQFDQQFDEQMAQDFDSSVEDFKEEPN